MAKESTESPASSFPRQFGKYHLLAPLAQGGMGALYIAATGDRGLERLLVIKTVLPHLADKEYVSRFRDEAKVVVQLSHQNLIQVFDAGQVDGELFLAMDFIEGKDLRAIWNRCAKKAVAFPLDVAVFIVKELCRGLGYAHSQGDLAVVHRDVSPPNVIVSYNGEVKLTDFGLAASTLKLEKTAPGIVYGKVSYMSPEQARGEALDGRSDLYAAGIILWELLTGRQLFPASADQGQDLLDRSANPTVPLPSARAPRVPKELDKICARVLSATPSERYPDGESFREALGTWLAKHHPTTDAARVERFLVQLFAEDIELERERQSDLLKTTRERVLTLPPSHELHKLFDKISAEELDRRSGEGPNLGRRAIDDGDDERDRRRVSGRRAVDKITEGVGTMLGLQGPATTAPGAGAAQALAAEVLLTEPKTDLESDGFIGKIIDGRYRIDELLGEGGMGRVYLAEHVDIGRTVAVKILHTVYSNMPDLVERFRREARAATKIGHPNIVDVTDSGTTDDGSTYFVMEYLDGVELGIVIDKEGALEVGRALSIATQICRALAGAHAVDIIHRDLKPENVFLTTQQGVSDFVKVLDFGIAKTGEAEKARERKLTSPGVAMGTPEYMAPEQAAGKPADERSDVYAVGAILYEMLSGIPPYEGANFMAILSKKATSDPPALESIRDDVPSEIIALVAQAMARDPDARPRSMEALEYELTKLGSGRGAAVANAIGLSSEISNEAPRTNPPLRAASTTPETPRAIEEQVDVGAVTDIRVDDANEASSPLGGGGDFSVSVENRFPKLDGEQNGSELAGLGGAIGNESGQPRAGQPPAAEPEAAPNAAPAIQPTKAPPAAAAPQHRPVAVPPLPSDESLGQQTPTRASRAGWIALLASLALFGGAVFYVAVIERDRGQTPPPSKLPTRPAAATGGIEAADASALTNMAPRIDASPGVVVAAVVDAGSSKLAVDAAGNRNRDSAKPEPPDPVKVERPKSGAQLLQEAGAALNSGKYTLARDKYREAIAGGANKNQAYYGLGRVAFNTSQFREAVRYGLKAGGTTAALQLLGDSYYRDGNCAKALIYYRKWAAREPSAKPPKRGIDRCNTK